MSPCFRQIYGNRWIDFARSLFRQVLYLSLVVSTLTSVEDDWFKLFELNDYETIERLHIEVTGKNVVVQNKFHFPPKVVVQLQKRYTDFAVFLWCQDKSFLIQWLQIASTDLYSSIYLKTRTKTLPIIYPESDFTLL